MGINMSDNTKLLKREQVKEEDKWAIQDLYTSQEEWELEYEKLDKGIEKIVTFQNKPLDNSQTLLALLELCDELGLMAERLYVYANQKLHEDTSNSSSQVLAGKAQNIMIKLSTLTSFITPEILKLSEETIDRFIKENSGLLLYRRFLDNLLRKREHILSQEMEEMLARVDEIAEAPSDIFSMFNNADLKFEEITGEAGDKVELTHGRYIRFLESKNRCVREEAFKAMYKAYGNYKNSLAAMYRSNLKQDVFYAKVRKYPSSLAASLEANHIPVNVYENLLTAVHEGLPIMYRYMALRKKVLGVSELHMYDLFAPMVAEVDMKIPYEEAKNTVKSGLAPLGAEYGKLLEEGFANGWIDVYENEGKRSGAYSWGAYGVHPYVLLNYQENLNNVFTLAHEMGHAIHSHYSDSNQPFVYASYKIFVAEVASTCNESLLIHHLMEHTTDKKEKAYLINYFLEQFRSTVFRQTMFAEFEKITHQMVEEGETLTAEILSSIYYDLNKKYYGDNVVVDQDIALEWARIPHFYTPFYVYQYATGFSAAVAISNKILQGDEEAKKGYFEFLSGGSSMDPIDLLKLCKVDMSSPEPVKEAIKIFDSYLHELEKLCEEI